MKIVYAGVRNEHYDPKRGYGFEYVNFYSTLAAMRGVTVVEHPFDRILEVGTGQYNKELLELVERERPDLFFAFMYSDELETKTLDTIKAETKSVAWFADDYWRFFNYSKRWAPHFTYAITTHPKALEWYEEAGITNVISSQWACNTHDYKAQTLPRDIDVSFVGQYKGARGKVVNELTRRGIHMETFGSGWSNGRVSPEKMQNVIARSKINLNLNVRPGLFTPSVIGRIILRKSVRRLVPDFHIVDNLKAYLHFPTPHIHARPFELAGLGAFAISGYAEEMERYYEDGKEMVFYRTTDELVEKIRYYLVHDVEREAIAKAGYERTLREHTYEARFKEIFNRLNLLVQ